MAVISVIVPVYRAERCLAKCVDSILEQTMGDFELLLIDDGSPDGSGALCDAYAARDERVRVFHKENGGVSSARNLGIEQAGAPYLAFADSDDYLEPDALAVLYSLLTENGADSAGGAHRNVPPSGPASIESGALPPGVYGPEEIMDGIVDSLMGRRLEQPGRPVLNGFIWRFLFSRSIIQAHAIRFEGAYLEDELFLAEYFSHARRLAMTDKAVYNYYLNPDSVTHRYLPGYLDTFRAFLVRKRALAEKLGTAQRLPDWDMSTVWAGMLIAVSNVYAPGSPLSARQQTDAVRAIARDSEFADAIRAAQPNGLSRNKQIVADLLRGGHFRTLTALYRIKNHRR